MTYPTLGQMPGIFPVTETEEKAIWAGRQEHLRYYTYNVFDSTAVDAGNTPTTYLRAGLIVAKQTADGNLYAWNPDGTDGTQNAVGVLERGFSTLDGSGTAVDKGGLPVLARGHLKASQLLVEGVALTSSTSEQLARRQLAGLGFTFDDDPAGTLTAASGFTRQTNKAADYTVLEADNGTEFTTTGTGVNYTLPTLQAGLRYKFRNLVDQNMAVTSAVGNDIFFKNDLAASSLTFSTMSEKIGAVVVVYSNIAGTAWFADVLCSNTVTVA